VVKKKVALGDPSSFEKGPACLSVGAPVDDGSGSMGTRRHLVT
jgi:hypothetical protein